VKRWLLLLAIVVSAACGGSRDAPRPIGPYPTTDFQSPQDLQSPDDDDNDGISNDQDGCPLAAEPWDDPVHDGCPMFAIDAGVAPAP
jgi:hypothetical protein